VSAFRLVLCTAIVLACVTLAHPSPASAGIQSAVCGAAGAASGAAGRVCDVIRSPGKVVGAVKNLVTGHVGSALKSIFGGGSASTASTALALAAVVGWVTEGAKFSLGETIKVLGESTTPQLRTTWFSASYWRIAGIAALLTLPFLFAAAAQALLHSDLALLTRAAIGYLPLAGLAIAVAAPLTMLLLAATDQLSGGLAAAAGRAHPSWAQGASGAGLIAEPFLRFLVALVTTACAIVLWLELAIREAAVYVIVLMLPLAFAAFVWPARRIWAVRAVELLVALILSKLVIVAVVELGGAALDQLGRRGGGLTAGLAGTVLVLLAALSPWAVLRLVPLSELASSAVGSLRGEATSQLMRRSGDGRLLPAERAGASPEAVSGAAPDVSTPAAQAELRRLADQPDAPGIAADGGAPEGRLAGVASARPSGDVGAAAVASDAGGAGPPGDTSPPGDAAAAEFPPGGSGFEGWHPMFRAPNYSWKPLTLGSDGDVTNAKLWPPDDAPADEVDAPAGDHEPLPPPDQDGPL
jgi:type IV secretion system protein TrbL